MENSTEKKVVFKNFNIENFKALLTENIRVSSEVVMEFSKDFVRCASISSTESITKYWHIPTSRLIGDVILSKNGNDLDSLEYVEQELDFETFDLYFLSAENFLNFLNVHSNVDNCEIVFNIDLNEQMIENRKVQYIAKEIIISSTPQDQETTLKTTLVLSRTSALKHTITDYQNILNDCEYNDETIFFSLKKSEIETIQQLVKALSKSDISTSNKTYLTFEINTNTGLLTVLDKVFTKQFKLSEETIEKSPNTVTEFKILKIDFQLIGKHDYSFAVKSDDLIIASTTYNNAVLLNIISNVFDKVDDENNYSDSSYSAEDDSIAAFLNGD